MWWLVMKTGRKADLLLTPRALLNLGRQASDANSSTSSENTAATGREPPRSAVDAAGSRTVWIRPHLDMKVKLLPISFFFFPRSMVSEQKGEKAIGLRLWTCDKNKHVRADTFQTTVTVGSKRTKQTVKTFIRTKLSELYSCYAVPQLIKLSRLFIKQQEVHIKYSIILHFLARFPRCRSVLLYPLYGRLFTLKFRKGTDWMIRVVTQILPINHERVNIRQRVWKSTYARCPWWWVWDCASQNK